MTRATRVELSALAKRYGDPIVARARITVGFADPIKRADRFGEVCMVVRGPTGRILLITKDIYPRGAFRLPTGGIAHGESVEAALRRETREETGLEVEVRRFLGWVDYLPLEGDKAIFHTFAFLLEETGGTLGSLDPDERILAYREVEPGELDAVADRLDAVTSQPSEEIGGDWADWGRFRSVVHRVVSKGLRVP
ncbi:MAG: NUDIX hydrolase [Chloroflexi bacterium]|nr:NUDIX hydrolase [Chloroflexota bacterium]